MTTWQAILRTGLVALLCVASAPVTARQSASGERRYIGHFVADVFERFFFVQWLGVPMSLANSDECPMDEVSTAVAEKARFPESFIRREDGFGSPYGGATGLRFFDPKKMHLVVHAPKVGVSCDPYVDKWTSFLSAASLGEAFGPYAVADDDYDLYAIDERARSIFDQTDWSERADIAAVYFREIGRFRLTKTEDREGFCFFEFHYEGARR